MKRSSCRSALGLGVLAGVLAAGAVAVVRRDAAPGATASGTTATEPAPEPEDADGRVDPPADKSTHSSWQGADWEPYKIAIGAFYALCLQKAFDTVIAFFDRNPVRMAAVTGPLDVTPAQEVTLLQLGAYIIWVSIYFLHNGRLYFRLRPDPARRRILAHGIMTVGFAFFYFFGATLGEPGRLQLVLISGIILTDVVFPLSLVGVTHRRARVLWVVRSSLELVFVAALFGRLSDDQLSSVWWAALLFALLVLQLLLIGPWEGRFQFGLGRHQPGRPGTPPSGPPAERVLDAARPRGGTADQRP